MPFCINCGTKLEPEARFCGECGYPVGESGRIPLPRTENILINTSGQGKSAVVPVEIKKWNWGAFFLNGIWGLGNKTYIALLCLIPLVNIIMVFVLGAKGSEWAWQNKQWESVEHFKRVQKRWARIGLVLFILMVVVFSVVNIQRIIISLSR
jgi:hypothetical protein